MLISHMSEDNEITLDALSMRASVRKGLKESASGLQFATNGFVQYKTTIHISWDRIVLCPLDFILVL